MMSADIDASELPTDWASLLDADKFPLVKLNADVDEIYDRDAGVLPEHRADVFRAFHLTAPRNVRVVILGQDPYPLPKWKAHGLAFSSPVTRPFPRSLNAIFKNLAGDLKGEFTPPTFGDLTPWAKRGVLLLNTALTVAQGRPGSHSRLWVDFTQLVLERLNEDRDEVVFLLWGNHAINRAEAAGIKTEPEAERSARVIASAHPTARGTRESSRQKAFKDCQPFSQANGLLTEPIDWTLFPSSQD